MLVPYTKKWLSISGQVQKLKDDGLTVRDVTAAELFLQHINYFRFSGYSLTAAGEPWCYHFHFLSSEDYTAFFGAVKEKNYDWRSGLMQELMS